MKPTHPDRHSAKPARDRGITNNTILIIVVVIILLVLLGVLR